MKLKKTILALVLSLCMVAACLPVVASAEDAPQGLWTDYAADSFAGGSGMKEDPYQIATAAQLALLAKDVKGGNPDTNHSKEYFILTANIDLSGHVWTPIGYETYASGGGSAQSFSGYFDGNNKKITGLYVDERAGDEWGKNRNAGLFGCIAAVSSEPVIQNLIVDGTVYAGDGETDSDDYYGAGILIGSITVLGNDVPYAVIKNCTVSGTVNSTKNAGGLVGDANYTHFENCTADVEVNGYSVSGGFVGNAFESQFKDCTASGDVSSRGWSTGGFAGILFSNTTVEHCAAFGKVEAGDWNLGGFVGYAENGVTIKNSIAMGDVTSNVSGWDPKAGGFLGTAWGSTVKLEKCHAAGKVTAGSGSVGGLIGTDNDSTIRVTGCSFDNQKNAALSGAGSSAQGASYEITDQNTAAVKSSICADYDGGHDMVDKPGKAPTSTEDGYEAGRECKRCGYREGFAVIKATGKTDDPANDPANDPTTDDKHHYNRGGVKNNQTTDTTAETTKPSIDSAKTADTSSVALWGAMLVISGAVIGTMTWNRKKAYNR